MRRIDNCIKIFDKMKLWEQFVIIYFSMVIVGLGACGILSLFGI